MPARTARETLEPLLWPLGGLLGGLFVGAVMRQLTGREHARCQAETHAELRLANDKLQSTVEELQRSDNIKGEFLNTVSHDLRIPLTTITGYAELLQDRAIGPLSDKQDEAVGAILAASERMKRLLEDLLDFARMEAGRFRLDLQEVSIRDLVEEARQPQ